MHVVGHGGGFHEVGERRHGRQRAEGPAEAGQQSATEVALGVGDESVVLVGLHVLAL